MCKLFFILIFPILFLLSCNDNPVEQNLLIPGKRNYIWTWDTLSIKSVGLSQIWGSSENDVWAVGYVDMNEKMWHYDGKKWTKYKPPFEMIPEAIYGFSRNDIWIASGSTFWHYDGSVWSKFSEHSLDGYGIWITDIWGESPNDIYAVGRKYKSPDTYAVIMHYNGNKWDFVNTPDIYASLWSIRKNRENNLYYLDGYRLTSFRPDSNFVFSYDGNNIEKRYFSTSNVSSLYIQEINGKVFIIFGKKIYQEKSNKLDLWKDFSHTTYLGRMWGRTEADFFCITQWHISHFNGVDFKNMIYLPAFAYCTDVLIFEKNVFFLYEHNYLGNTYNIVIRGKLN